MKQSILVLSLLLSLASSSVGQQNEDRDREVPILNAGTTKWPLTLTKAWFEGDTIYNLTFRNTKQNSKSKISTQGFYIFELKAFGEALQAALSIDADHEVQFL